MNNIPTPITDDYIAKNYNVRLFDAENFFDFTRDLERQLAEVTEQRDRLAESAKIIAKEYEDRRTQWGAEHLWLKHEDTDAVNKAIAAVKGGQHE